MGDRVTAFVFPGQGSQTPGMGKALYDASAAARAVFGEVDEALHRHLSRLMFEGPADELTLTANAQPAIMAASMAALAVLEKEGGLDLRQKVAFVAGHSLGEYSALTAARAFALADAARLLRFRGEAMQRAVPEGEGAMAAVLALSIDEVRQIADEAAAGDVLAVANDNAPGQIVLSGAKAAVERAVALAKERKARRIVLLPVSAPFHCPLMAPAARAMEKMLAETTVGAPVVPLYANVTAAPVTDPAVIRALLVEQVTATVRWRESVAAMAAAGVARMVELGGKVLTPMGKRIAPEVEALAIEDAAGVEALLKIL